MYKCIIAKFHHIILPIQYLQHCSLLFPSFYHPFKCMYIYNVYISTYQFLTFLFTARRKKFKCIFKFLSMLFSAAAVVYSIRIWWNLLCCSILWNTEKSTFPFLAHISLLSSSLRSKEINAFNHTFFEGIRAKTFWYFFVSSFSLLSHKLLSELIFLFCCFHLLWNI